MRKIALIFLYCAALVAQGCAVTPAGFNPVFQSGPENTYENYMRPSGG